MLARLALTTSTFALGPVGGVVYKIKYLMNLFFTSLQVVYCPRECNRVAHAVAALGCKCPPDIVSVLPILWSHGMACLRA